MGLLDGKVAVVTGAGRGIGREEALVLAAEGAKVIVNDVGAGLHGEGGADVHPAQEVVDLIKKNGGDAAVNGDDISSWQGGKNVVEQAIDTFGSLDILVNNAGILRDKMSFNMDESDWDDVIRVHLKGHFAATHHAAVYWRNRSKSGEDVTGRIINTSSEAGLFGNAGQANYAAAKAGIAALTWVEARELSRYGVTSNAIAPRARTRMTETLFGGDSMGATRGLRPVGPEEHRQRRGLPGRAGVPGRLGTDLRRLRRQHLGHERVQGRRSGHPRRLLDSVRARRGQGRHLQGHQLGRRAVQLHLADRATNLSLFRRSLAEPRITGCAELRCAVVTEAVDAEQGHTGPVVTDAPSMPSPTPTPTPRPFTGGNEHRRYELRPTTTSPSAVNLVAPVGGLIDAGPGVTGDFPTG